MAKWGFWGFGVSSIKVKGTCSIKRVQVRLGNISGQACPIHAMRGHRILTIGTLRFWGLESLEVPGYVASGDLYPFDRKGTHTTVLKKGSFWEGHLGSFGGPQGQVACRDEIFEILGGSQEATTGNPSLEMPILSREY